MATSRRNPQISLRPQDLMVVLRLALERASVPTYATLADELGMTSSEVHAGVDRAALAGLVYKDARGTPRVIRDAVKRFVVHGAGHAFPAIRGPAGRGTPTGYAAPPLSHRIVQPDEPPPVWPDKDGTAFGTAFYPLYPSAPLAARRNERLYELLALFDAVRGGSARERQLAASLLDERL